MFNFNRNIVFIKMIDFSSQNIFSNKVHWSCIIIEGKSFSFDFIFGNNGHIVMKDRFSCSDFNFVNLFLFHHCVHFLYVLLSKVVYVFKSFCQFAMVCYNCILYLRTDFLFFDWFVGVNTNHLRNPLFQNVSEMHCWITIKVHAS